jgi:cell division transport system permease protein
MSKGVDTNMKISTFKYFTVDATKSLSRNKTLSLASIATVAAALFIFGIFMLGALNVGEGIEEIGSKLEVKIFLNDDVSISDKSNLEKIIKNIEGVNGIKYENKREALEKVKGQLGENSEELVEGFEERNPFPNSYIVKVEKPEYVSSVVEEVTGVSGVEKVRDAREVVDKIIKITKSVKWIGYVIFGILFFVSLFLIGNTIKLTVFSRKREIGIMKYVGATDWFIRWPFVIEGVIIGIIGSLFSSIVLYYIYNVIYLKAAEQLVMMQLVTPAYILGNLMWKFIFVGAIIGAFGSMISIRRFLKV